MLVPRVSDNRGSTVQALLVLSYYTLASCILLILVCIVFHHDSLQNVMLFFNMFQVTESMAYKGILATYNVMQALVKKIFCMESLSFFIGSMQY